MKVQAKPSRRTIPAHPDVVRLINDLQNLAKDELAPFLRAITQWIWPRSELYVWVTVLDRFDEIMADLITQYDAANIQLNPFSSEDKELLYQILRFERMLLDNSTNRKLFSSYDRLSIFVTSPDVDIAIEALGLILRPAHQYTSQMSLNIVLRVNHSHLEYLARSWPVLREYSTSYLKLLSPQEERVLPPEASDVHFQWYSPKSAPTDHGPHQIHLTSLSTDTRDVMTILQEAVGGRAIGLSERLDLMCKIRVAKSLGKGQVELRSKLVILRLLAIAVYCHTHTESAGQNAKLLQEPDIVSSTAPLLAIDKGIQESVQAAAVHALDGLCHHRFRSNEVLTAVNVSVAHGLLMSLFRKTVSSLDDNFREPPYPLFDALQTFLDFLTTHEVSYNMIIGAGLIEHLRKIIADRQPSHATLVAKTIPLLDNALYGPPPGPSSNQRNNSPFSTFMGDSGIQFLLERIKYEVDSNISKFKDVKNEETIPLGYGRASAPNINVLKHLLRTIQRMIQSPGSAEVLRLLPEPESAFIPTLKNILENRHLFGSSVLAIAMLVISGWVHNEPSSLAIIQENKLPESFYALVERGIEPMIEVIHGVLNAMGALSLNQAGQTLLESRSDVISTVFGIFTSELHLPALQEKSNASLVGGDVDELVRHHPWLKPSIFKAITDVLESLKMLGTEYTPRAGTESSFNLVPTPKAPVDEPSASPGAEEDAGSSMTPTAANSKPNPQPFELSEMSAYQYLNNFSKFLTGFFTHAQHCRDVLNDTGLLKIFDEILTLSSWPIELSMGRNMDAILLVNRRLMDASPSIVLKHRIQEVKSILESKGKGGNDHHYQTSITTVARYVSGKGEDTTETKDAFGAIRHLLIHLILLNDVYSQASSHSIHQPFRREPVNMLSPLSEDPGLITQMGDLSRVSAWEILQLRAFSVESNAKSTVKDAPQESSSTPTRTDGMSADPPNLSSGTDLSMFDSSTRKRSQNMYDSKGKAITPEEKNFSNVKYVLQALAGSLESIFSGIAKSLSIPRRLASSEISQFKNDSKSVTKTLAVTLVNILRSYKETDDPVQAMGFCALAISNTNCIGPDSRQGFNIQTALFLEFQREGGIEAIIQICGSSADMLDGVYAKPQEERSSRDKEVMAVAHHFLRHPLLWFFHLASGKSLLDSAQTAEIARSNVYEGFTPRDTLIRLRLELLPLFKRLWEASWLLETSESVRRAVILGLLAILKGEFEESLGPTSLLAVPEQPQIIRRPINPPISPAMVQQLTDMGFQEAAARGALTRARGNLAVATELLLTNAHLYTEDANPSSQPEETEAQTVPINVTNLDSNVQNPPEDTSSQNTGAESSADAAVQQNSAPDTDKRDFAKELGEAREELKNSIVPTALRLADANPAFIDDIRDVFTGPSLSGNAKTLVNDIKVFCSGGNDVPEVPFLVRCRILALAYVRVGSKGLGFSKEDITQLLQNLLSALPSVSVSSETNLPKWLSSLLMLCDRILCGGEDIAPAAIPQNDDPIESTDLFVGPDFADARKTLFDFCIQLIGVADLQKDDLSYLFGILATLTRSRKMALQFVKQDGINLLLQHFKKNRQSEDICAASIAILRHIMEDRAVIEDIMRRDLKRWNSVPRSRPGENVVTYVRSMQHAALREPRSFIKVTSQVCELVEPHPGISGGYRLRPREGDPVPSNDIPSSPEGLEPDGSYASPEDAMAEAALSVIHRLVNEMTQQNKQNAEQSSNTPVTGLSMLTAGEILAPTITAGVATSGNNTPLQVSSTLPAVPPPALVFPNTKEPDYNRYVQNVLCELLLCYEACKTVFLTFPRRRLPTGSKDVTKFKPLALSFLLQEIGTTRNEGADWPKRRPKPSALQLMVVSLCADVGLTIDMKEIPPSIVNARKIVLDNILKALKEPLTPSETIDQRYGRYISLADLCQKLLTVNPHAMPQKSPDESLIHIAQLMLEKNFVSTFASVLSEIDLAHPLASVVTSYVLTPLETLTKASIKLGRSSDRATAVYVEDDRGPEFISESEEGSELSDAEELPDPYSTSALGMYGGETEGAFVDVEEPVGEEEGEEDDIEMEYGENEYDTEGSQDEEGDGMEVAPGGEVDPNEDDDTDLEGDEEMDAVEDEEGDEGDGEENSDDEDSVSDGEEGQLGDDIWQELEVPRDENGVLLPEPDDEEDIVVDGLHDTLGNISYALGGDLGEAPIFVHPSQPINMEEIPFPPAGRFTDIGTMLDGMVNMPPGFPPMDGGPVFDFFEDFGRTAFRRGFRAPQIIRTSTLQEMLGGPTAQMIQDMGRNGDIQLAISGPAAHIIFNDPGFDPSQFRHRLMSRYMPVRSGRGTSGRDGDQSVSLSTGQRWSEEARINAGPGFDERLGELANHVVVALLPAAREAARIQVEEAEKRRKEEEEKEKAELEAKEKAEAEEKARAEAEAALERQLEQERSVAINTEDAGLGTAIAEQTEDATMISSSEPALPSQPTNDEAQPPQEASSSSRPRVTVMYRGESIDITDADIDPEFLNAVPEDIRDEIIGNFVQEQQRQSRPARIEEVEMDTDFLSALPADIREDVLRHHTLTQLATAVGAVDMDPASVLATFPEELRQTVLLEQDDAVLESMPSAVLAEATALRQRLTRRGIPPDPSLVVDETRQPIQTQTSRRPQYRETAQLLDKSGMTSLVRLLFFVDQNRRTSLQQVLVNLCENNKSRTDTLNILLSLLHNGKNELAGIDQSFSQMSVKTAKSSNKGKQKENSAFSSDDRGPEEQVVLHRALDALMSIVHANEAASMFFLTEQEITASLHRTSSKKGKGKEKVNPTTHYPFVQLLTLLERPGLLQQAHSLDTISGLLCTVTKPLTALRIPEKQVSSEPTPAVIGDEAPGEQPPAAAAETGVERGPGTLRITTDTTPNEAASSQNANPQPDNEPKPDSPPPQSRDDIIRSKPPHFPDATLRLVVNLLTMGECSSRCFQNTQALIFNLSSLPNVRETIIEELCTKAEEFGRLILLELDALVRSVHNTKRGEELPSLITTKFSLPTSNQARLLRILKILENIYMPSLPGRSTTTAEPPEKEVNLIAIFQRLNFANLWRKLSDCLKAVEERTDSTHVATFLLPLMESLMVVCKFTAIHSLTASSKAVRASASPRSPTLERDSPGDIFVTFTDRHRKALNLMIRNKPSLMFGSFSLLVQNPRVLDFDNKRSYFIHKLRHKSRSERDRISYSSIPINVRRAKVFEDSFQAITRISERDLKYGKLNVRFTNEEGVDAGGVTREWFRILAREIFNPNYALFSPCGADRLTYQPNPASWINPDHLRYFKFVGRILGKAIYDQKLLDGHFARSVYRQLLGKPVDYRDLEWSDPSYYSGLRWMLDNSVEAMDLTFSEQNDQLGQMIIVDLKPNGRNIPVTDENKDEYIQLIAEYRLTTSIKDQLTAFLEGFYEIVPKEHIAIFDEKEVELLISGTPEIDVEDWRSATEYHGYTASDAVIVWWWRALKSFSRADRAKVLSFATGTAKVPLGGFAELQGVDGVQRFSIHKDYGVMDRLPQAHTCFNQIDLPQYSSYEKLRQQLLLAINEGGEGFGFA